MRPTNFIKIAAAVLLIALSMGCQTPGQTPTPYIDRPVDRNSPAAAYYYFSAAQVKLKQGDINESIWYLQRALQYDSQSTYLRLELANLLLIKKDDTGALEQIKTILSQQPDHIKTLILAGRIYQQRNENGAAKDAFEKALAFKPDEQPIYLLLGRIYWDEGDFKNATRIFSKMVMNFPDFYASHYFYGKVLVAQGELDKAEKSLIKALKLEPALQEPYEELLKIYKSQNNKKKISKVYADLLEIDPENHNAAFGLADHYRMVGQHGQAKRVLFNLGRKATDDNRVVSELFDRYIEPKKYESALWLLKGMLPGAPTNSDLNYLSGLAADGLERSELALQYLSRVAPKTRFYQNAVVQSAIIHHDMGNIDNAIKVVRQAISHTPDNPDYYLYLGSFFEELQRYDDALESLRQGVAQDDKNPRLHFRMGVILDRIGMKQESIKAMRRVLQLSPNNADALNYLGYTYADMGIKLNEAEVLIQSALKIKPDDGYITDSLGWVYYKRGQYSEALRWLKKAVSLVPDDPTILEHIGDVYLKMDSQQKALDYYQRSLNKNDKDRDALRQKIRTLAP